VLSSADSCTAEPSALEVNAKLAKMTAVIHRPLHDRHRCKACCMSEDRRDKAHC